MQVKSSNIHQSFKNDLELLLAFICVRLKTSTKSIFKSMKKVFATTVMTKRVDITKLEWSKTPASCQLPVSSVSYSTSCFMISLSGEEGALSKSPFKTRQTHKPPLTFSYSIEHKFIATSEARSQAKRSNRSNYFMLNFIISYLSTIKLFISLSLNLKTIYTQTNTKQISKGKARDPY